MSNRKLSELPTITTPADDDLIHIVDVSDTSDPNAGTAGTDKKITRANLIADAASAHTHVVADVTDITASAAELNKLDGVTSTAAQLDYSSNLTSDIQTQLNSKSSSTHTHTASDISDVTASAAELSFSDGVTSNIQSQITAKADASHSHTAGHISDVTASAAELNLLDGVTATTTELNYIDGVTSAIQTQIDAKSSTSHDHALDDLSNVDATSGVATGKLLKYNGSTWAVSDDSGEANQNAFSNVAVSGQSSVSAETATDTLTLAAGSNVTLTTDGSSDSVTIAAADTNATHTGEVTGSTSLTIADDVVDEANLKVNNSPSDDDVLTYSSGAGGLTWTAGGTSATNLSATANGTSLTVESSTGTNVALPQASGSAWGVMSDEDKSKLDAIEPAATADMTGAQIKTAYENENDTNAFTDADHTKLDAISPSADVTDATTVAAAGALMDSEVTNLADVKAFDTTDYAASSHTHSYAAQGANSDITSLTGLTTDLSIAQGGTGESTAQAAIDSLSAVSGATNEHVLTKDTSTGNAIWKAASGGGGGSYTAGTGIVLSGSEFSMDYGIGSNQVISAVGSGSLADNDFLRIDGNQAEGRSASEVLSDIGAAAASHTHSYAAQGANGDITSLTGLTTGITVAQGGTGLTATGTAKQVLGTNSAANAIEWQTLPAEIGLACGDESTAIDSSGYKVAALVPRNMKVTSIKVSLTGEDSSGIDVNVYDCGSDPTATGSAMLSSDLTVTGAYHATGTGFSVSELHENDHIRVKVTSEGGGEATGLKVWLLGYWN